jgi:hypothetical protein
MSAIVSFRRSAVRRHHYPKGESFADMVTLKGKSDIGDQINKKILGQSTVESLIALAGQREARKLNCIEIISYCTVGVSALSRSKLRQLQSGCKTTPQRGAAHLNSPYLASQHFSNPWSC